MAINERTWFMFRRQGAALPLRSYCTNLCDILGLENDGGGALGDLLWLIPWGEHETLLQALEVLETEGAPAAVSMSLLRRDQSSLRFRAFLRAYAEAGETVYEAMLEPMEKEGTGNVSVQIRTFGFFDVFKDGEAIPFAHAKSKELLALLVDRQGGFVSCAEAASFLWEDESTDSLTLSRCRKVAMRLKETLEQYGIGDIVENRNGKRRIIPEKVSCDLFDYLNGGSGFSGYYMSNYSWAEPTLAQLIQRESKRRE